MKKTKIIIGLMLIITIFILGVSFYLLNSDKEPKSNITENTIKRDVAPEEVLDVEKPNKSYKAICSEKNDEIPANYFLFDILFYDDLEKCTKVYRNKPANNISDYIVKRNDNSIKKIENVNPYNFKVSSDGAHIGYASGKMGDLDIVFDNKSQKYKWGYKLTLSPNGKNFGYIAWRDNKYYLVVERKDNYRYQKNSTVYYLELSSDGRHVNYISGKLSDLNIPFDDKSGEYEWDYKLTLPLFGINPRYIAQKDGKYYFVAEGENSYRYEKNSMINKLEFSPDSKNVAFDGNSGYVVYDGREEKQYSGGIWPAFSPSSRDFLHADGDSVMLNGKEIYKGDKVISPQISPDKVHIAYININGNKKWQVFSDGIGQKEYDEIYMLEFSPENKHLTYVGKIKEHKDGKDAYYLVLDGKEIEKYYSNIKYNPVYNIVFSPDEAHVAYTVRYNSGVNCPWNYYVVLNGQKDDKEIDYNISKNCLIKNCDSCEYHQDLVFSSDGKYFAFVSSEKYL